jgi:hypothetical protein
MRLGLTLLTENLPFFLTVMVIILGAVYSNSKITEVKKALLAEFATLRANLQRLHNRD